MGGLTKLKEQTLAFAKGLSSRAKVVIAVGLLATVVALAYLMASDHTSYATLFSGLTTEDAAGITQRLKKEKVPFRLAHGGSTVAVPEAQVHELRLRMAGEGLPRGGGVGFEIFDKQKLGVSDFAQQVNYRRALQGELARTITQLDAIKSARVHLAMPRRQLFARAGKPVSASVTVRLRRGRTIDKGAVKAVVHLVSSSVNGLAPGAVSVMDTRGRLLWGGKDGEQGAGAVDGVLDYRKRLETTLERRVSGILDRALGVGRSVVKVTADTAISSSEQTEERFDPEQVAIRSESRAEEKNVGSAAKTAGVAGVRGNLPGAKGPKGGRAGSGTKSKRLTRNYEITKKVSRKRLPAGELKRLSVAVLVDQRVLQGASKADTKAGAAGAAKDKAKDAKGKGAAGEGAAPQIDLAALEALVQQAVGYSAARGDVVTLKAVPFALEKLPREVVEPAWAKVARSPYPYLAAAGLIAAVFFLLLLRRRRRQSDAQEQLSLPATVRELQASTPLTAKAEADEPLALEDDTTRARALAEAAAEHDARRAAQVLRVWLAGG
jgi:flagellar M-ring protein FliF